MADAENQPPPSKKRAAGREISKDDPGLDDDEDVEQETGTFKKASEEVLATRRIVKVRRSQPPASTSSNPFAKICLVPPSAEPTAGVLGGTAVPITREAEVITEPTTKFEGDVEPEKALATTDTNERDETKATTEEPDVESFNKEKSESVGKTDNSRGTDESKPSDGVGEGQDNASEEASPSAATTPLNSFRQLSSNQNAFMGISGTGFSSSTFSFGSLSKDGSAFGAGSGSLFGSKNGNGSFPSFNFGGSNNGGGSSLFATASSSLDASKSQVSGMPSMQEVLVETGEENEKAVFSADAVLFEYIDGGWKERGKGEVKVNVATTGAEKARLVMRARGNYRLILNASLFPDMKLTNMDKRGITFACMNSAVEGKKDGLTTFALKFKDASVVEEFRTTVTLHKDKKSAVLKTPENSPKASDD